MDTAQGAAASLLREEFDHERGFPVRAASHTDLWPGDRWTEAYVAIDEPRLAEKAFNAVLRSTRPDGSIPHLMQGSHKRFGIETNWIDRQVYRFQGNGALRLANGEHVTRLYAPPTWAMGALALYNYAVEDGEEAWATDFLYETTPWLIGATEALYKARSKDHVLVSGHRDELTNSSGRLATLPLKTTIDPAINVLLVANNAALSELVDRSNSKLSRELRDRMDRTKRTVNGLGEEILTMERHLPEFVLAAARLGFGESLPIHAFEGVYALPNPEDKHPEKSHLSTAECVEIARLTPDMPQSKEYLMRFLGSICNGQPITRFEGVVPGKNVIDNKVGRKQIWLPTAAEIARIPN